MSLKTVLCAKASIFLRMLMYIAVSASLPAHAEETFIKVPGIDDARIRRVAISDDNPSFMAVASDNTLYLSKDAGASFSKVAVLKDETINHVSINGDAEATVYLAGSRNGYRIGERTEKIFTADEGDEIHFIRRYKDSIFAGTSDGLYFTESTLLNWQPLPGLRNKAIHSMEMSGNDIYLAGADGVYLFRTDGTLKRLFITRSSSGEDGALKAYQVRVDTMTPSRLWLCTSKGVYSSNDRGDTWQKLYINGAGNIAAYCLAQFPLDGNHFYLCSDAGFFKINIPTGRSRPLFNGLPTSKIRWMDISASGAIYLATDQGLFKQVHVDHALLPTQNTLANIMKGEPSIREVQEAAMRYNSVHPDKTGHWRRRLKYRALLPKLDVDYDKTIGSSFTSSGYYYAQGPYDWGVSLTWDMGNLLWNSYEDDIDNRTKLTTQLRLDILDEVNRLYFERMRLKHEIIQAKAGFEDTTLKQLRLYELTATLDGYTGGIYSR